MISLRSQRCQQCHPAKRVTQDGKWQSVIKTVCVNRNRISMKVNETWCLTVTDHKCFDLVAKSTVLGWLADPRMPPTLPQPPPFPKLSQEFLCFPSIPFSFPELPGPSWLRGHQRSGVVSFSPSSPCLFSITARSAFLSIPPSLCLPSKYVFRLIIWPTFPSLSFSLFQFFLLPRLLKLFLDGILIGVSIHLHSHPLSLSGSVWGSLSLNFFCSPVYCNSQASLICVCVSLSAAFLNVSIYCKLYQNAALYFCLSSQHTHTQAHKHSWHNVRLIEVEKKLSASDVKQNRTVVWLAANI